jgi:L-fuconolactonase
VARTRAEPHRAPLGKDELLAEMARAGVDRVVIVPPSWEGDRNDLAIEAAKSHPDRFATMGRFDPDAPNARETLEGWKSQPGMLGVRGPRMGDGPRYMRVDRMGPLTC